jgi:hypothetical protein
LRVIGEKARTNLSTANGSSDVKSKDLVAQKIFAVCDALGNGDRPACALGSKSVLDASVTLDPLPKLYITYRSPLWRLLWVPTKVVNLEPRTSAVSLEVGAAVGTLCHVVHNWARMGTTPLIPLD